VNNDLTEMRRKVGMKQKDSREEESAGWSEK
jgi:hypothetical protein